VVGVSSILFYLFFSRRVLGFPWTYLWRPVKSPFIASVAMGGVVFFLVHMTGLFDAWSAWSKFFGILFFGSTTYISVLLMMEKKLIMEFLVLAKQSVR